MHVTTEDSIGLYYVDNEGKEIFVIKVGKKAHAMCYKNLRDLHTRLMDVNDAFINSAAPIYVDELTGVQFKVDIIAVGVKFDEEKISLHDLLYTVYPIQHRTAGKLVSSDVSDESSHIVVSDGQYAFLISIHDNNISIIVQGATLNWVDIQRGDETMRRIRKIEQKSLEEKNSQSPELAVFD